MKRGPFLCALLTVMAVSGGWAQDAELIVRRAKAAGPVELRGGNLAFVLPEAAYAQSLNGAWMSRSTGQEATLECRPLSEVGLLVRYGVRGRMDQGLAFGRRPGEALAFTISQRPTVVAQFTETTSLEAALESQARFDASLRAETLQRREAALRSTVAPGLTVTASGGQLEARDAAGRVRDQNYVTLSAEQRLPGLPVRLTLAPTMAQESWRGADAESTALTGWNSALALDATPATTLSLSMTHGEYSPGPGAVKNAFEVYAAQLEQRLAAAAVLRLRASYEEQWVALDPAGAAIFLGVESTFPLTEAISGMIQLRQRAAQLMDAAAVLPDTVLSFSLGGSF